MANETGFIIAADPLLGLRGPSEDWAQVTAERDAAIRAVAQWARKCGALEAALRKVIDELVGTDYYPREIVDEAEALLASTPETKDDAR